MTSQQRIDLAAELIAERRRVTRFRNRRALAIFASFVIFLTTLIAAVVIQHHTGVGFVDGAVDTITTPLDYVAEKADHLSEQAKH